MEKKVAVWGKLPCPAAARRKSAAIDYVIQAPLQVDEELFARNPLGVGRLVEGISELPLQQAIESLDLLLLAQFSGVIGELRPAALSVLTRGVLAPINGALLHVASLPLEKELDSFAPTNAAD